MKSLLKEATPSSSVARPTFAMSDQAAAKQARKELLASHKAAQAGPVSRKTSGFKIPKLPKSAASSTSPLPISTLAASPAAHTTSEAEPSGDLEDMAPPDGNHEWSGLCMRVRVIKTESGDEKAVEESVPASVLVSEMRANAGSSADVTTCGLAVGSHVMARFGVAKHGTTFTKWFPGRLHKVNSDGTCVVWFDDYDVDEHVKPQHIKLKTSAAAASSSVGGLVEPSARADQYQVGTVKTGADGLSKWRVVPVTNGENKTYTHFEWEQEFGSVSAHPIAGVKVAFNQCGTPGCILRQFHPDVCIWPDEFTTSKRGGRGGDATRSKVTTHRKRKVREDAAEPRPLDDDEKEELDLATAMSMSLAEANPAMVKQESEEPPTTVAVPEAQANATGAVALTGVPIPHNAEIMGSGAMDADMEAVTTIGDDDASGGAWDLNESDDADETIFVDDAPPAVGGVFARKQEALHFLIEQMRAAYGDDTPWHLEIARGHEMEVLLRELGALEPPLLKRNMLSPITVAFHRRDEPSPLPSPCQTPTPSPLLGVDGVAGAASATELYTRFFEQALAPEAGLFEPHVDNPSGTLLPRPAQGSDQERATHLARLRGVGCMILKCTLEQVPIRKQLSRFVYAYLLAARRPLNQPGGALCDTATALQTLEEYAPQLEQSYQATLRLNGAAFDELERIRKPLALKELSPHFGDGTLTLANCDEKIHEACCHWLLECRSTELAALRAGFTLQRGMEEASAQTTRGKHSLDLSPMLQLFDVREVARLVTGSD